MRALGCITTFAALALIGCGNSRNSEAVDTCAKAIADKLTGKSFEINRADMAEHAKSEGADMVGLASTLIVDKGLSMESRQTFECRVRFEAGKPPSLLFLQFNWSNDDLKKARDNSG